MSSANYPGFNPVEFDGIKRQTGRGLLNQTAIGQMKLLTEAFSTGIL